jgi:hypothetical protein
VTKRERRKRRWFDAGREAAERASGRPALGYACPICARWFASIEDLTFEHAPPNSLGGREVTLTCVECNSTAGHELDAELRRAQDVRDWSRARHPKPLRGRFEFEGIPLNVDVDWTPDGVTVVGIPSLNDPANTAAQQAAFERIAASDEPYQEPMRFSFAGYREQHARVALLRSAYIAAFARLGYRYALRPTLEVVREQILDPDAELIERFSLHRAEPVERRAIAWIAKPRVLESVVVQIDDHLVFLPGAKLDGLIYDRLAARKVWPPHARTFRSLDVVNFGWPTEPDLLFDQADRRPAP